MKPSPNPIAEVLDKLIEMAREPTPPSFRDLVIAAGLDPERDLVGASLRELDFRNEDLQGFDFSETDLTGADFRRAKLDRAVFRDAELTGVIGLIGARFRDSVIAPEMIIVPPGTFQMGSGADEGFDQERPRHLVTIERPFAVGRFPVTLTEWDVAIRSGGLSTRPADQGWGRGRRPVINVSWEDARAYVAWLARETGRQYRLLSEAEWEYCCRAGTTTAFSFGSKITKKHAQFAATQTQETGYFPPNAWGLHDMHGNVWEWCEDNWHANYNGDPAADGSVWQGGDTSARALRGGSWDHLPQFLRSDNRNWSQPVNRSSIVGFRVARTL